MRIDYNRPHPVVADNLCIGFIGQVSGGSLEESKEALAIAETDGVPVNSLFDIPIAASLISVILCSTSWVTAKDLKF